MDLGEFLRRRGVSQSEVSDFLLRELAPRAGDVVFFAGSLASGIGTCYSDLDVFIVRRSSGTIQTEDDGGTLLFRGIPLDVETKSTFYVEQVISSIVKHELTDLRSAFSVFRNELEFINRVRTGIPIYGDDILRQWQEVVPWAKVADRLKMRALVEAGSLHCDLCGFLSEADIESALFILDRLAVAVSQYVIFTLGRTDIGEKWALRVLRTESGRYPELKIISEILHSVVALTGSAGESEIQAALRMCDIILFLAQLLDSRVMQGQEVLAIMRCIHDGWIGKTIGKTLLPEVYIRYERGVCAIRSWRTGLEITGNWQMGIAAVLIEAGAHIGSASHGFHADATQVALAIEDLREVLRAYGLGRSREA